MDERSKKRFKSRLVNPILFLIAAVVIIYFIPRESKFKYTYSVNRPWLYGLLTAPFDFHIQKSEKEIQLEKDSIMKSFLPYYTEDKAVGSNVISQFTQTALSKSVPDAYISYVTHKLSDIYDSGIISAEDFDVVMKTDKKQLKLRDAVNKTRVSTCNLKAFYTLKSAYEKILNDKPASLKASTLSALNLNDFLIPNILYDRDTSDKVKKDLMNQVVIYDGMVQSGEKIIDRGEIVDAHTLDILNSYTKEVQNRGEIKSNPIWLIVGQSVMVVLLILILAVYILFFRPRVYKNRKEVLFILLSVVIFCLATAFDVNYKFYSIIFVIPFTMPTILIRTFIDSWSAMVVHSVVILLCALMVPQPAEFMLIQFIVGFVAILSLRHLSERSQLLYCALFILLTYFITYTGWILCFEGDVSMINWRTYVYFCFNFIFVTFTYVLVYVCERIFGFISEVSMIELSNINRPLLQKLSEVAPGTFQHSLQVSNLVSAAAVRIGANAPLVRTGALYHDIGKIVNPAFFTENQSPGMNPHAGLSYKESARIIIDHVAEGIKIAKKYNLPQQIIDFIETHHGKGKAKFFYNSYKNEHPDEVVDEAGFSYPGPNPFSRETALLMMADTVEAASRSLPEYTEESITNLVNNLIDRQLLDGLMRNAPITFQEIEIAKKVYIDKLVRIYHSRIAYPELKLKNDSTENETKNNLPNQNNLL